MKHSPVCTIIKNLTNSRRQFFIDRGFSVTLTPAGTPGATVTVLGDAFSRDASGDAEFALLLALKKGDIEISYKVDYLFPVASEVDKPAMSCDSQAVREWYFATFAEAQAAKKPVSKSAEIKNVNKSEEPVNVKKDTEPAKTTEQTTKEEPTKVEQPKTETTQQAESETPKAPEAAVEDTKVDVASKVDAKAAAPSAEPAKKSGRRIKVS